VEIAHAGIQHMTMGIDGRNEQGHDHEVLPEWGEVLVRSVAHLAAQLTTVQIQMRALAEEVEAAGGVDEAAVRQRLRQLAVLRTGPTLRENLGPALADLIDMESLERDLIAWLSGPRDDSHE
jgi:hypothetical protein